MQMLYDRWRQVARNCWNDVALIDSTSGQCWTFGEVALRTEQVQVASSVPAFPRGLSSEFIFEVLRAWRSRSIVCPLEHGQTPTRRSDWPAGSVHLKTTSASTGVPRLIAFTAEQLAADVDQIVTTLGLRRDWPNVAVISLAHSYGFSNLVLPLLLHGIPLVLVSSPLPEAVRRAAELAPHVTLPAVPALWRAWLEARAVPGNVRLAISAGAPLPLSLEAEVFKVCGLKIHNFYGASECGGIAYDRTTALREGAGWVGAAMDRVELSLSDDGLLCVRSPAVGITYWPEPDPRLAHGFFRSTDLARLEQDSVFLLGRETDQINVAGRKVSPESIEAALATHPEVRECLVFGAPSRDADRTEMIVACVVVQPGVTTPMLREHLLHYLPPWQLPRNWWFVPSLGTNARGKTSRAEWRKRYLDGRACGATLAGFGLTG